MNDKKKKTEKSNEPVPASDVFIRKSQLSEFIRYLIVGFSVTIITLILLGIFNSALGIPYDIANAVACLIMIFGAFPPYKIFVFKSRNWDLSVTKREFITFFSARIFSFVFDILFVMFFVRVLGLSNEYPITIARQSEYGATLWEIKFAIPEEWIFKFISMVVTTIANYIFSKFVIFKKKNN